MILHILLFSLVWFIFGSWLFLIGVYTIRLKNHFELISVLYWIMAGPVLWITWLVLALFDKIRGIFKRKIYVSEKVKKEIDKVLDNQSLTDSEKVAMINRIVFYECEY